jgi:transposase
MHSYPRAAVERMMKVQEVILRAMAKKITWWQAAEIIGTSDRQMRRWHGRYREHGYDGLLDRRVGKPSPQRVPLAVAEQVLGLYQEKYFDLNVRHFHGKLREQHQIRLSCTWVKKALIPSDKLIGMWLLAERNCSQAKFTGDRKCKVGKIGIPAVRLLFGGSPVIELRIDHFAGGLRPEDWKRRVR